MKNPSIKESVSQLIQHLSSNKNVTIIRLSKNPHYKGDLIEKEKAINVHINYDSLCNVLLSDLIGIELSGELLYKNTTQLYNYSFTSRYNCIYWMFHIYNCDEFNA